MKKNLIFLFIALCYVAVVSAKSPAPAAGKSFNGTITFQVSYPGSNFDENVKAMLPKIMIYKVKGNKCRSEMTSSMFNQTTIFDGDAMTAVSLIDMMGNKMAIKMTKDDLDKDALGKGVPSVALSNETKVIAGYNCKKATITITEEGNKSITMNVFYSEELGSKELNYQNPLFRDINGLLMEYEIITPEATMKFVATAIEKGGVTDKDFEIPEGYKVTTKNEFQKQMGGGD